MTAGTQPVADLCLRPATELVRLLANGEISARSLVDAHLDQIERLNPSLNALVTLVPEAARAAADQADTCRQRGEPLGPLHGLPIAHKDLFLTKGIRTTLGSPIFSDHVPDEDALIVERFHAAGAIVLGKTNTAELGAGSQTFNTVFGATRNPYNPTRTCGGSSGGSAVAVATGMVALADGTDMGGSLRNPASFCNVVGLRPSPGRIPEWPEPSVWWRSPSVSGPMARTVGDVALALSVLAGFDARDPLSLDTPGSTFAGDLGRDFGGVRLAWSPDLGGLPVDPQVAAVFNQQREVFGTLGCVVEDAAPDLSDADEIFKTWRAWAFDLAYGELLDTHPTQLKDTIVWNISEGRRLTGPQLAEVERQRSALHHRVRTFMEQHEFVVLPVSQVVPFDVDQPYPTMVAHIPMETYIDWMRTCYYISVTGLPAIAVPAGFTPDGLPVGLQIVGRYRDELGVLQLAAAFEAATGCWTRHPEISV